jgi:hypothetical protein
MIHYHIRWSRSGLDWESFHTYAEAEVFAEELLLPGETFKIEEFGENCPRCKAEKVPLSN